MYSDAFCKVYNEFGWNYFPEAFGEQLLEWIRRNEVHFQTSLDLGCGTGVLCEILTANGIEASGMDFFLPSLKFCVKTLPQKAVYRRLLSLRMQRLLQLQQSSQPISRSF